MSGNCNVFDDIDLLEEILVRVPHESIFNCILVSKRWFGKITGSCFREHYIRRWRDEAKLMQRQLRREPVDVVTRLQNRLQSQQLAALNKLQHWLAVELNQPTHQLDSVQVLTSTIQMMNRVRSGLVCAVQMVNQLHRTALAVRNQEFVRRVEDGLLVKCERLDNWNELQRRYQSRLLAVVEELLKSLPTESLLSRQLAAVNQLHHQIVSQLLVAVNQVQGQQYWDMMKERFDINRSSRSRIGN